MTNKRKDANVIIWGNYYYIDRYGPYPVCDRCNWEKREKVRMTITRKKPLEHWTTPHACHFCKRIVTLRS